MTGGRISYNGFQRLLDIVFILSISIAYASLIKYITYSIFPISEALQRFLFLFFVYLLRFQGRSAGKKIYDTKLFRCLVYLFIWEIFQGLVKSADLDALIVGFINLCTGYVGLQYIINLISETNSVERAITPSCYYAMYTFFAVTLLVALILFGLVDPNSNMMAENSLLKANMETAGITYYFPAHLSIVYNSLSIFLSPLGLPSFSGLSHESQAMFYAICPAFFLMFYKYQKIKYIDYKILFIFSIFTLFTTSFTAIMAFLITFLMHILWKSRNSGNKFTKIVMLVFIILIFTSFISSSVFQSYAEGKLDFEADYSSAGYSMSLISYILTPNSILGSGIFSSVGDQVDKVAGSCGYVSSVFIITFIVLFVQRTFRSIFSANIMCHSIGLASLYFILHSLKYGIVLFNSTYVFFIVILLSYSEFIRKKEVA